MINVNFLIKIINFFMTFMHLEVFFVYFTRWKEVKTRDFHRLFSADSLKRLHGSNHQRNIQFGVKNQIHISMFSVWICSSAADELSCCGEVRRINDGRFQTEFRNHRKQKDASKEAAAQGLTFLYSRQQKCLLNVLFPGEVFHESHLEFCL